ncbi:porin [Arcticibacterium luteifluviistationis]|uniref:Porin n=1 Tax=Arcticibacterium luteifluviistationis TaxID=1784714 RepID=A0A2Z4GGE1_9BACT|nr:porin [Arcticibacterium luteifluviistationis]AWW00307.1 porin [Arcticibacterium luteifluviistationis]
MDFFRKAMTLMVLLCLNFTTELIAQKVESVSSNWYERLGFGGYTQLRYNRLFETTDQLECDQCDKSLGADGGFFLRRSRVKFAGNVAPKMYAYLQFDMATSGGNSLSHLLSLKDAYFDVALDDEREYRFRIGQSKVPYSFENMQSSSNRLALDRNDALNSAAKDERDLGVFFYYTPVEIRKRLAFLTKSGLKGSGDYGMFGFGLYNGQGAGRVEKNDNIHAVIRMTYPFEFTNGQLVETSIQAYKGKYTIPLSEGNLSNQDLFDDERIGGTLVVYPQPFGFQTEYNIGKGPEFNPGLMTTELKKLKGGYAQVMYRIEKGDHTFIPFIKYQYYDGGKKFEIDARSYLVKDTEIGVEWQYNKYLELVALYMISDRTFEDGIRPIHHVQGNTLRLQLQLNY